MDLFAEEEDGKQPGGERPARSLGDVVDVLDSVYAISGQFVVVLPLFGVDGDGVEKDEEGLVDLVADLAGEGEESEGLRFVVGHGGHVVGGRVETHGCAERRLTCVGSAAKSPFIPLSCFPSFPFSTAVPSDVGYSRNLK